MEIVYNKTVTSVRTMSLPQKLPTTISSRSVSYKDMGEVSLRRSPPRILVVDDNQDIMGLMQELLFKGERFYEALGHPGEGRVTRVVPGERDLEGR